jgi:radical SAM protein with 4Fe4S-binding SPASM domain
MIDNNAIERTNQVNSEKIGVSDYFYERHFIPIYDLIPPFPNEVLLDVTSFCNHACTFCANSDLKLKTTVNKVLALNFIKESFNLGARRLGIFGTGESFIFKQLHEYIKYAKDIGFEYVYIKTNGALCTIDRFAPVLDANLDSLRFSIHAGTRETYNKIQGKDDFLKVLDNIRQVDLYRKQKSLGTEIAVSLVLTNIGGTELNLLKNQLLNEVDIWDVHELNSQCGNLLDNNEKGEIMVGGPRFDYKAKKCKQPFSSLSLTPEGYISACIMDFYGDLIVGNFNEQNLKEIWEGETYIKFRRDHLNNNLKDHICYSCIYNKENQHQPLSKQYSRRYRQTVNTQEKKSFLSD